MNFEQEIDKLILALNNLKDSYQTFKGNPRFSYDFEDIGHSIAITGLTKGNLLDFVSGINSGLLDKEIKENLKIKY